jgi:hypothetical protein
MATVMFISETGVPHTAFQVNGGDWYGYKPTIHLSPIAPGFVDRSDRTAFILHKVTFQIVDDRVQSALTKVLGAYKGTWYKGLVNDCVTFAADFAEALGLSIPPRPNFSPDNFVVSLGTRNGSVALPAKP